MGCSGIGAQIGFVDEVAYGTAVSVSRFLYFEDETIALDIERMESPSLGRGANTALNADDWESGKKQAAGPINMMVRTKGFGLIFEHMMGANSITTPGGGTLTRDHTCTLATLEGQSLTVQVGRPDRSGTVHPFTYVGTKFTEWEIKNSVSGFLELTVTTDAQDETTTEGLGTASYATSPKLLAFTGGAITIGGTSASIKNVSITGSSGLDVDDFSIGSNLKAEPCQIENWDIGGSIDGNFVGLTDYNRFVNGTTSAALVFTWTGPLIEGAFFNQVIVTLPVVRFDGTTPPVSGPEILQQTLPFKALGSAMSIVYRTTDTSA